MPHVVLIGSVSIETIFRKLHPILIQDGSDILRTKEIYLERKKNVILIDSLVIESEQKVGFFTIISGRDKSLVIRLFPNSQLKKTKSIKRLLAEIAKKLMQSFPDLTLGETNLEDYLKWIKISHLEIDCFLKEFKLNKYSQ